MVKVGHKQVVNMIRHGGNHLIIKVVTVSRNPDPDDTARKKGMFITMGLFIELLSYLYLMDQPEKTSLVLLINLEPLLISKDDCFP